MFIEFKVISSDSNTSVIRLNYNGEPGTATYDCLTDTFEYTNDIDTKIDKWRAILWLEKRMKKMIDNNQTFDIYAVG